MTHRVHAYRKPAPAWEVEVPNYAEGAKVTPGMLLGVHHDNGDFTVHRVVSVAGRSFKVSFEVLSRDPNQRCNITLGKPKGDATVQDTARTTTGIASPQRVPSPSVGHRTDDADSPKA